MSKRNKRLTLEEGIEQYLRLRNQLGYKTIEAEYRLKSFATFMREHGQRIVTTKKALAWAKDTPISKDAAYQGGRLSVVRGFCRYFSHYEPRTEIPSPLLLPQQPKRAMPHIYSDLEVRTLLENCGNLHFKEGNHPRMRRLNYFTLFGLIAVTGMRRNEALALNDDDVDLTAGTIRIKNSKFGKSRTLPLHPTTVKVLVNYRKTRNRVFSSKSVTNSKSSFFVSDQRTRITGCSMRAAYCELMIQGKLRGKTDSYGPRVHDLRHTFAVRTMVDWYRKRENVGTLLPYLSAYLGHKKPSCTYWYLSAVPELVGLAASRLEEKQTTEKDGKRKSAVSASPKILTSFGGTSRRYYGRRAGSL